ncbi:MULTISPECIES: Lrp/AsnC family transcriptional regulator [Shewanella]|uniref:Lrp/AsnC family transcriptional regulator n=2 Tax=Shewanella TaxID=22 RepID=A0A974XMD5_9GAMM|nr:MULTISPECIES: Lrp/AsnC family transcriptional regulator [Shewanella]QSX29903.1 Lrp/AsnC family transcriptional regulator [Shewanella cyperi]QSX37077.1 Lrp/AsnC family transcriptional regulator [Shewanella sedimentimangrovi]QSX40681.1 Lrp/AsnC family transcriptional regulator [Shewanella cyperi]
MDKKDLAIIDRLQRDGRISISELAASLNMSDTPCIRRIRKLEQDGVISGYAAQLDPHKAGFNVIVYAAIRLSENSDTAAERFETAVAKLPEVMECSVITGSHDYLLKIVARDLPAYERFVKKSLGSLPAIAGIESTLVLKQTFSRTALPLSAN